MTPDRRVPQSHLAPQRAEAVRSTNFVFPKNPDRPGTLTGGPVLRLLHTTGAIAATRFAPATLAIAAIAGVSFGCPNRSGLAVEIVPNVVCAGRMSPTVMWIFPHRSLKQWTNTPRIRRRFRYAALC